MRAPRATCASVSGVVFKTFSAGTSDNGGLRLMTSESPDASPAVAPPLSLGLRDFGSRRWFGGPLLLRRAGPSGTGLLSSVHQLLAVLLPERFRGGCAFGSRLGGLVSPARV